MLKLWGTLSLWGILHMDGAGVAHTPGGACLCAALQGPQNPDPPAGNRAHGQTCLGTRPRQVEGAGNPKGELFGPRPASTDHLPRGGGSSACLPWQCRTPRPAPPGLPNLAWGGWVMYCPDIIVSSAKRAAPSKSMARCGTRSFPPSTPPPPPPWQPRL